MEIKIEDIAVMDLTDIDELRLSNTLQSKLTVFAELGTPALTVAELCSRQAPGGVVVVVSPTRKPLGIFNPKRAIEGYKPGFRLKSPLRSPNTLRDLILEYEALDAGSLRTVLRDLTTQELGRPVKIYCEPGAHFGDGNPCSEHSHSRT